MTTYRAVPVVDGFTLLEAPRWHEGELWLSDFFSRRVLRAEVEGPRAKKLETICEVEGRPSGLGFMPDGALRISSMDDCRLLEWRAGRLEEVASYAHLITGPSNDLVIDREGRTIIGNFGLVPGSTTLASSTSLISVDASGEVSMLVDDVIFPNGMVIDHDLGVLYVAETYRHRITAFDYSHGGVSGRRTWFEFDADPHADGRGPYDIPAITATGATIVDGLARDDEGGIWAANASGAAVRIVAGQIVDVVETGGLATYSLVLGGSDGRDLYLCCAPPVETFDPRAQSLSVLWHARVEVAAAL